MGQFICLKSSADHIFTGGRNPLLISCLIFPQPFEDVHRKQLKILGSFYRRDFQKDKVQADELLKDFDQIKKALASGNNTLDQKPYLHFFLAYALKERSTYREALVWVEKATALLAPQRGKTALRIYLSWMRVECLLKLGRSHEALGEILTIENDLLARITHFERRHTELAFNDYTQTLKGVILATLGNESQQSCILKNP